MCILKHNSAASDHSSSSIFSSCSPPSTQFQPVGDSHSHYGARNPDSIGLEDRLSWVPNVKSGRRSYLETSQQDYPQRDHSVVAESESQTNETRSFLLWIDGVGVWQLLMGNHFLIGAPSSKSQEADLAIQANVRKQHAAIRTEREDWVLDPLADTSIANQRVSKKAHLQSGDQIRLGDSVELGFRLPSPLSNSAVLDFESGHRPLQSVDGVILLTDHCIVGPRRDQHIYCPTWQHSFVLFRRELKLLCRSSGDFQANGESIDDVFEICSDSMIESEYCRFRVEVIR